MSRSHCWACSTFGTKPMPARWQRKAPVLHRFFHHLLVISPSLSRHFRPFAEQRAGYDFGGFGVGWAGITVVLSSYPSQGLTRSTPVWAKSFVLRVAHIARCVLQMAAIWASAVLIGIPACSRADNTSA